jgi:hypothetical protein
VGKKTVSKSLKLGLSGEDRNMYQGLGLPRRGKVQDILRERKRDNLSKQA